MPVLATPGASLTPAPQPQALQSNYIKDFDFTDTELPGLYSDHFEIYGDRTIAGFLRATAAEYPCASDLIKWSEQGRLHAVYTTVTRTGSVFTQAGHAFREKETVVISDGTSENKGIISAVTANTFTVECYASAGFTIGTTGLTVYVYGTEVGKASTRIKGDLEAAKTIRDTNPITIRGDFAISGSDMTQIDWVETKDGEGNTGYLWYLQSKHEERLRFDDRLEMSMIEGTPAESGSDAATNAGANGTKGLFFETENNGNVFSGIMSDVIDFEDVIERLDKQGQIAENMFFVNRRQDLAIDDFIASQNSYGEGGTSYGAFNNNEKMALNLGFYGFRKGSYEFYKTSWKYLNDPTTRGAITGSTRVNAMMVPAGTKTIYDELMGESVRLPFLHVKYRQTANENRRYRTWITGGAGGANTNDEDSMTCHFLSERALVSVGVNNFFISKG